jgi:hypothetical protein
MVLSVDIAVGSPASAEASDDVATTFLGLRRDRGRTMSGPTLTGSALTRSARGPARGRFSGRRFRSRQADNRSALAGQLVRVSRTICPMSGPGRAMGVRSSFRALCVFRCAAAGGGRAAERRAVRYSVGASRDRAVPTPGAPQWVGEQRYSGSEPKRAATSAESPSKLLRSSVGSAAT